MNSSHSITSLFAQNTTVKAWCVTSFFYGAPLSSGWGSQASTSQMTERNFIDGYNLNFDDDAYKSMIDGFGVDTQVMYSMGAIPFKFVTPLDTDTYKIFVQPKLIGNDAGMKSSPLFAFALNTKQYPKTKNGFWIRYGQGGNSTALSPFMSTSDSTNHLRYSIVGIGPQHGQIVNRNGASATTILQVLVL